MIGTTKRVAVCAALLALGGAMIGCGDDDDTGDVDAGRDAGGGVDSGTAADSGPSDAGGGADSGSDGGTPRPLIRLANLISNAAAPQGAIHVCMQTPAGPTQSLITSTAAGPAPIPYGGVSGYVTAPPFTLPGAYTFRIYAATFEGMDCPATTEAIATVPLMPSVLEGGEYYTIAAVGRAGASDVTAATLKIIADDNTEPPTDMVRLRIVHGVTMLPAIDVCFDPDYVAGAVPMPGAAPGEPIAANLTYVGAATEVVEVSYRTRAPMTGPPGAFLVYAHGAADVDCANPGDAMLLNTVPLPFPVPPEGTAGFPPNLTATVDAGDVVTLFLRGHAATPPVTPLPCTPPASAGDPQPATCTGQNAAAICHPFAMRCVHPEAPTLTPWIDDLGITR